MNPTNAPTPAPYDGLSVRTTDVFPLTCVRCQRRFTEINDFVARTTPIFHSSGLMEREDPATGTFVLLLRNCLCGTSLALRCKDRRDRSDQGRERRDRFDHLVGLLTQSGFHSDKATFEARRLIHEPRP